MPPWLPAPIKSPMVLFLTFAAAGRRNHIFIPDGECSGLLLSGGILCAILRSLSGADWESMLRFKWQPIVRGPSSEVPWLGTEAHLPGYVLTGRRQSHSALPGNVSRSPRPLG